MNKYYYDLEKKVNAHLKAIDPMIRPVVLNNQFRAQSVAYSAKGFFEVTASNGHRTDMRAETVAEWLTL
jgi:hypothetical protein